MPRFRKIRRELLKGLEFSRFALSFLAAVIVYNWTEAGFKTLHPMWFAFYIIALDYPQQHCVVPEQSRRALEEWEWESVCEPTSKN